MRLIGAIAAGEILETAELNDALGSLNQMLSSWNTEGASLVGRTRLVIPISGGVNSYALTQRPVQIVAGSASISYVDSPLEIVDAAGYEAIPIPEKGLTSIFVKALLRLVPLLFGLALAAPRSVDSPNVAAVMTQFASLADTISLPENWNRPALESRGEPCAGWPNRSTRLCWRRSELKASLVRLNASNQMRSQAALPIQPAAQ
jgi:hypothetical protein